MAHDLTLITTDTDATRVPDLRRLRLDRTILQPVPDHPHP